AAPFRCARRERLTPGAARACGAGGRGGAGVVSATVTPPRVCPGVPSFDPAGHSGRADSFFARLTGAAPGTTRAVGGVLRREAAWLRRDARGPGAGVFAAGYLEVLIRRVRPQAEVDFISAL